MALSRLLKPLADLRYPALQDLGQPRDRHRVDKHINDNIARINETFARVTAVEFQHGVPRLVPNPFANGANTRQPLAFLNGYAETSNGTRYDIASVRFGSPRTDGLIEVTVNYAPPPGAISAHLGATSVGTATNGATTTVPIDTVESSEGDGFSLASNAVTCAYAGVIDATAIVSWSTNVTNARYGYFVTTTGRR